MSDRERIQAPAPLVQQPEQQSVQSVGKHQASTAVADHPVLGLQRSAGNRFVQGYLGRQARGNGALQPGQATQAALGATSSRGRPLPESIRASMGRSLGTDLSGVRVHTDSLATSAAQELNASAFTWGQDIYFGGGNYQPNTSEGQNLLAHEVVHTVQQGAQKSSNSVQSSPIVSQPADPQEKEADAVARHLTSDQPVSPVSISTGAQGALFRQDAGEVGADTPTPTDTGEVEAAGADATTPGMPAEEVLLTSATFEPSEVHAAYLEEQRGRRGDIRVRLGNIARGTITVRKRGDNYNTTGSEFQSVPLMIPALQPLRQAGVEPVLAVKIRRNTITGHVGIPTGRRGRVDNPAAAVNWIKDHSQEMGWLGMDVSRVPGFTNRLQDGQLLLQLDGFQFILGGFLSGSGNFGLTNDVVTFDASATVSVRGLTEAQLEIDRDAEGNIGGRVEVPVSIQNFSGNLLAVFGNGTVDIRGTVAYATEKLSGEITLLVTDAATARNVALEQLGPEAVQAAAEESSGESGRRPRPGERALAGWGILDFAFTEWMTGRAQVIIDNEGHITVVGEIAPPAEIELFPQRDYVYQIFTVEVRTLYGVPLVGNVFLFANIGMDALAKLGPGKIYNIRVEGTYSTDPRVFNRFSIAATLNISAFAGLRLRAEGGVGVELLDHDIKAGAGVNALAGVRGYVEATPIIGYREIADPEAGREGQFYINGHMELVAQPFLGLGGDLFVELDSPWWSPAPDEKWTWPLGQLEYPLPGEFGIGADVDYVIGSGELPQIQVSEVDFNADKFMTDLMNDHVPPKSQGEQNTQGEWQEGQTTGESAEPTQVDSQGAPPQEPAQGRQTPGEGEPPAPEVQQRWLQGIQALGQLSQRSESNPLEEAAINRQLEQLKRQYGFADLRATRSGEDWIVLARMNPTNNNNPLTVQGVPPTQTGPQQPGAPTTPTAPSGRTAGDPIPMVWFKPPGLYPPSIQIGDERYFFSEPEPLVVPPLSGLPDVRRTAFTGGEVVIGINPAGEFYPREGRVWPRVRAGVLRTGTRQANFRRLLREYGYDWGSKEADHVRDLQWGGQDDYHNLWPLERSWNNAANRVLQQNVTYRDDDGNVVTVRLQETPLNRWFRIDRLQRP